MTESTMPPDDRADAEVWQAAVSGSPEAWGELFRRHNRTVYNYCFRRTLDWGAAEDLTSAVFLEAWRRREAVGLYGESALPWLYGIATMLTRSHHTRLHRYRELLARVPSPPEYGADHADAVAERLDALVRATRVRKALAKLSTKDREVLELAALEHLSHQDIATALGVAVGTVKSRLSRARTRLGLVEQEELPEDARSRHAAPLRRDAAFELETRN
jgi:RNA polymerase sigma factor (sigma-70 family)